MAEADTHAAESPVCGGLREVETPVPLTPKLRNKKQLYSTKTTLVQTQRKGGGSLKNYTVGGIKK